MPRYNLKNNPELAKERHRQQNREWYKKHKEQKMEYQRKYRARRRGETRTITYTTEIYDYDKVMDWLESFKETQVQCGYVGAVASDGKLHTIHPNKKDEK